MNFASALREVMAANGYREEHVALAGHVTTSAVKMWLQGKGKPSFDVAQSLRRNLAGFAERIDREAVA